MLTKKSWGDIFIITRCERAAGTKFFERQTSDGKKKASYGAASHAAAIGIDAYNEHSSRAGRPWGRPRGAFLINQRLVRHT